MNYNKYMKFTSLIDTYRETGNQQILLNIRNSIDANECYREELIKNLVRGNEKYICVFTMDEQVKIANDLEVSIIDDGNTDDYVNWRSFTWILIYVSDKALDKILSTANEVMLVRIMHEIRRNISVIGHRYCDSSAYYWLCSTNIFSRMGERMTWWKIYRKCKKNLRK